MATSYQVMSVILLLLCWSLVAFCTEWEKIANEPEFEIKLDEVNNLRKQLYDRSHDPLLDEADRCEAKEKWLEAKVDWCRGKIQLAKLNKNQIRVQQYVEKLQQTEAMLKHHRKSWLCRGASDVYSDYLRDVGWVVGPIIGFGLAQVPWSKLWNNKNQTVASATENQTETNTTSTNKYKWILRNPLTWLSALLVVIVIVIVLWCYFTQDSEQSLTKRSDSSERKRKKKSRKKKTEKKKREATSTFTRDGSNPSASAEVKKTSNRDRSSGKKAAPKKTDKRQSAVRYSPQKKVKSKKPKKKEKSGSLTLRDVKSETDSDVIDSTETSVTIATKKYPKTAPKNANSPASQTPTAQAGPSSGAPQQQFTLKPSKPPTDSALGSSANFTVTKSSNVPGGKPAASTPNPEVKSRSVSPTPEQTDSPHLSELTGGTESVPKSPSGKSKDSKLEEDTLSTDFDCHKKK